jgi:hypothetical protein
VSKHVVTAAVILLACSMPASAQIRVEGIGALSTPVTTPGGVFITDYVPQLVPSGGSGTGGAAGQTINLDSGRELGFEGGVNLLFTPRVGAQVLLGRETRTFEGANTPYDYSIEYLARQPPDYVERAYSSSRSFDWPDTTGDLTAWHVAANGLARVPVGSRADVTLTGGLQLSRPSGGFERAVYHQFRLGGHSVLFYDEALVSLRFAEDWHAGVNGGAELAVRAGRHIALTAGVRWRTFPDPTVDVARLLDGSLILFDLPLDDVQAAIGGVPADFDRLMPVFRFGVRIY